MRNKSIEVQIAEALAEAMQGLCDQFAGVHPGMIDHVALLLIAAHLRDMLPAEAFDRAIEELFEVKSINQLADQTEPRRGNA